jgi:predicted DNA-binding transcriptional regulator AlpA
MAAVAEAHLSLETILRNLSVPEAARYTGLSEAFLNRLRSSGGGPRFVKAGARVIYRVADIDAWLAARVRRSTSDMGEAK